MINDNDESETTKKVDDNASASIVTNDSVQKSIQDFSIPFETNDSIKIDEILDFGKLSMIIANGQACTTQ